jgi:peptidyl-tRNA hydrolase, PTH2 family
MEHADNEIEEELVQYFIVNQDVRMSAGKLAVQVAHVATQIAVEYGADATFQKWHSSALHKKIVLQGKEVELRSLIDYGFVATRDAGLTEIPVGTLTVVGLPPMKRSDARQYVKRFQLYKA